MQQTFDFREPEPARQTPRTIDDRFAEFCEHHADVLALFQRFARELRDRGHKRIGAKLLVERIRFEKLTSAHGAEAPAINNDFSSRLARWLIEREPSYAEFFELREIKTP